MRPDTRQRAAAVVLVLIVAACSAGAHDDASSGGTASPETRADVYVLRAEDKLKESLKDAGSAKFRNVFVSRNVNGTDTTDTVCGEVNSKNALGGYAGFKPFVATPSVAFLSESLAPVEWLKTWHELCARPLDVGGRHLGY